MNDRARLNAAFDTLEQRGFATLRGELCCNSCSLAALPEDKPFAFWHEQNEDQLTEGGWVDGEFCIGFGPDEGTAAQVRDALKDAGLTVVWSGDVSKKVCVIGRSN